MVIKEIHQLITKNKGKAPVIDILKYIEHLLEKNHLTKEELKEVAALVGSEFGFDAKLVERSLLFSGRMFCMAVGYFPEID